MAAEAFRVTGEGRDGEIITVPPTNGPRPRGLTTYMSMPDRARSGCRRIGPSGRVRVSTVEVLLQVKIIVSFLQDPRAVARVDIVSILPGVVIFLESFPSNLELEPIAEPPGVHVFLHHPIFLVINLDGRRLRFASAWDCIGLHLG